MKKFVKSRSKQISGHVQTRPDTSGQTRWTWPIKSRTRRRVKTSLTKSIAQQVAVLKLFVHTKSTVEDDHPKVESFLQRLLPGLVRDARNPRVAARGAY